jgi:hypothetical protein
MKTTKTFASVLVGLAALAAAPSAHAADFAPAFMMSHAGGYIDVWPAKDFAMMIFGADLQFRIAHHVFLDATISGAYVDGDVPGGGRFKHAAYGNPTIGAHYATEVNSKFAFFVGGTLTPPILVDPDGDVAAAATIAAPIRGYYDADRFWPGYMAIRAMGGIEWHAARRFYFRAELRPVVYARVKDRYAGQYQYGFSRDAEFMLEQAVEGEYRLDNGLGFGLRLQGVATFTRDNDLFQVVAEPFLALTPRDRGLYLRLGFPCALDHDLGFCADRDKLATVRFAIGGQW